MLMDILKILKAIRMLKNSGGKQIVQDRKLCLGRQEEQE